MPPKGASTAVTPTRLPPLPKLRVRRPNRVETNPCVRIMTSMLGELFHVSLLTPSGRSAWKVCWLMLLHHRMLGFLRIQRRRMRGVGTTTKNMYG